MFEMKTLVFTDSETAIAFDFKDYAQHYFDRLGREGKQAVLVCGGNNFGFITRDQSGVEIWWPTFHDVSRHLGQLF
jgi:hypothetical protein